MPEIKFTNKNSLTSGEVKLGNFKGYIFPWEKFVNFVVHHLTIFDALIERGFQVFQKVTIGN